MPNIDRLRQKDSDHDGGKKNRKMCGAVTEGQDQSGNRKRAGINPKAGEAPTAEESNSGKLGPRGLDPSL
jgi:hypothetical protein